MTDQTYFTVQQVSFLLPKEFEIQQIRVYSKKIDEESITAAKK